MEYRKKVNQKKSQPIHTDHSFNQFPNHKSTKNDLKCNKNTKELQENDYNNLENIS